MGACGEAAREQAGQLRDVGAQGKLGASEHPRVTIIVPVYNTEAYLDACMESLVGQTFPDIEILCVDDGSRDSSGAMLDAWAAKDARVRVIHQANAGVSHARNVALDNARGEWVLFVDSDDFVDLNTCEKLLNIATRDQADIVVFGGVSFPSVGWIDGCFDTHEATYRNDSFRALFGEPGSHPLMCNKMYRRSLLDDNGLRFNERLTLGEDNAFQFCTFPRAQVISYCRDTFYHYRCEREGSAVNAAEADRVSRVVKHMDIVRYVCEQWREAGFTKGQEEALLTWASHFLFNDIQHISLQDRAAFAEDFRSITDGCGIMAGHAVQDPYSRDVTDFVRGELQAGPDAPKVSVVAVSCYDERCLEQGFTSLANQYLQDVELLCVDAYPDRPSSQVLARLVAKDARARMVESVEQALGQARAPYVIFAHLRDHYDWYALRDMVAAAEGAPCRVDVVTVRDWFDHLRTQDVSRRIHMLSNDGTLPADHPDRTCVSPRELGEVLLSFSSLDASNKLWRTAFAREASLDPFDAASVAHALACSEAICPLGARLFERGSYAGITPQGARGLAEKLGRDMARLRDALEEAGAFAAHEKGYVNAYLSAGMCLRELMRSDDAEVAFLEGFCELLRRTQLLERYDKWWFFSTRDLTNAATLLERGPREFIDADRYERVGELMSYINTLEGELAAARGEVDRFYRSISFRIGRAVTKVPRALADMLRRVRG